MPILSVRELTKEEEAELDKMAASPEIQQLLKTLGKIKHYCPECNKPFPGLDENGNVIKDYGFHTSSCSL